MSTITGQISISVKIESFFYKHLIVANTDKIEQKSECARD